MRNWIRSGVGVFLATAFLEWSAGWLAAAGDAELERFLKEYPEATKRLEQAYSECRGRCSTRGPSPQTTPAPSKRVDTVEFRFSGGYRKVTVVKSVPGVDLDPDPITHCEGNGRAFSVWTRHDTGKSQLFSLDEPDRTRASVDLCAGSFLAAPYSMYLLPMSRIMKLEAFAVQSVESFRRGKRELMRVRFSFGDPKDPYPCVMEVDLAMCWAIVHGELHWSARAGVPFIAVDVEYGEMAGALPTPKRVTIRDTNWPKGTPPRSCEFLEVQFGPTPATEFTLPWYGLPDITQASARSMVDHPAFWVMAAALACLDLAWVFRVLGARSRARIQSRLAGFTQVETLVVIAILGLLAELLIPAVQSARETSRRISCLNNLKQIALAAHAYNTSNHVLPMGRSFWFAPLPHPPGEPCFSVMDDRSFLVTTLPYLDQVPLFNAINQNVSIFLSSNETAWAAVVNAYVCPDDTDAASPRLGYAAYTYILEDRGMNNPSLLGSTSYAGVVGDKDTTWWPNPDCSLPPGYARDYLGCITRIAPIPLSSVTDGISSTLLLAERSITVARPLDFPVDKAMPQVTYFNKTGWWFSCTQDDSLVSAAYPPNAYRRLSPSRETSIAWSGSASSLHPGGVNVAMADGSVRWIKDTIDSWGISPNGAPVPAMTPLASRPLWQAISTRNGAELVALDGD